MQDGDSELRMQNTGDRIQEKNKAKGKSKKETSLFCRESGFEEPKKQGFPYHEGTKGHEVVRNTDYICNLSSWPLQLIIDQ